MVGVDVPVSLFWIASDGTTTEVAVRSVAASNSNETIPLTIPVTAPIPGTYRLRVEAKPQDGELVTVRNWPQTAFVEVREGGGRILYLEGELRYEQTLLRRSLRRFQDLDLTFRPILKDSSRRWPIDLNDAFQPGKFDIYIIGDLDANALGEKQLGELAEAISEGAGLITLGGFQSYGAGGYATSPLADVIPIKMDRSQRQSIDSKISDRTDQLSGPIPIVLARRHPVTDLGGDDPAQLVPIAQPAWRQPMDRTQGGTRRRSVVRNFRTATFTGRRSVWAWPYRCIGIRFNLALVERRKERSTSSVLASADVVVAIA